MAFKWTTTAEEITEAYNVNLKGNVAIVTGANSGIGTETARVLALRGARVIIPCRTMEKAEGAITEIKKSVPNADMIPMQLELGDLSSVRCFAKAFLGLNLPLHILINNAGIMACPKSYTKDGFETQFGVNHLGHFLLVALLTDRLKASAPSRIVIVSSCGNAQMAPREGIDFDDLPANKQYNSFRRYGESKLANVWHAKELQRQFDAESVDITVTSLHPGAIRTNLQRSTGLAEFWDFVKTGSHWGSMLEEMRKIKTIGQGASTSVFCAVSPDVIKGEYYADNKVNRNLLHEEADNLDKARTLWKVSEQMVGLV
ncbi:hypothetical protein BZG36_01139 [Bifiguratus adelaidae]|uniref:Uncharacterized protein n=1 Tax=Bifiguratus adelaidae TaxID=1938954 RepID=A0A261Y629_9FUNG|nr:hypothetical protein BZG36_01139 [Bifiguratus adelaidae]